MSGQSRAEAAPSARQGMVATRSAAPSSATASTPTLRAAGRKYLFWVVAAVGALLVAFAAALLAGGTNAGKPTLGADNPAPAGGMALVEVLRQQGVTVVVANDLAEARAAAASADDPTLFFYDENGFFPSTGLRDLAELGARTVVVSPDFALLRELAPSVGFGGVSSEKTLTARCDLPAAERAGTMSPGGTTLRVTGTASGVTGCFPGEDDTFSVVRQQTADRSLTLVAPATAFTNEEIATYGNGALALNLLGESETLVWYLPTLADVERTGPPSLGELTPGWVTPTLLLLIAVFIAAALWRGRRFGPLVRENLPVVVKASETMEGRARLYARSSARLRAIDALRVGAVERLARQAGLSRMSSLDEVVDAVAALTGRPAAQVRATLVDDIPSTDRDLIRLSRELQAIERETVRASNPAAADPATGRPESADAPSAGTTNGRMDL